MLKEILSLGSGIIDKIFPDKEKAQEAKIKLMELEQQGELSSLETRMSAILAEAKSNDPWTSRARPTFMYVIYLMIVISIPMGVLSAFKPDMSVAIADGMKAWLGSIPDGLWATFGIGYTGYSVARSMDKKSIMKAK